MNSLIYLFAVLLLTTTFGQDSCAECLGEDSDNIYCKYDDSCYSRFSDNYCYYDVQTIYDCDDYAQMSDCYGTDTYIYYYDVTYYWYNVYTGYYCDLPIYNQIGYCSYSDYALVEVELDVSNDFKIGYTDGIAGTLYDNYEITYLDDDNMIVIDPCNDIELVSFNYGSSMETLEFYVSGEVDENGNPTADARTRSGSGGIAFFSTRLLKLVGFVLLIILCVFCCVKCYKRHKLH